MKIQLKKRAAVVAAGMAASLVVGGVAFAAWTATGTGSGTAKATTASALTTTVATVSDSLYPGKTGADLKLTINNPNKYQVTVTGIAPTGTITSDKAGCDGSSLTVATLTGLSDVVAAEGSATVSHAAVSMDNSVVDACQGATFTIPVTLSGASS